MKRYIFLSILCSFFCTIAFCQKEDERYPFKENNLYGIKDGNGKVIFPAEYKDIRLISKNVLDSVYWISHLRVVKDSTFGIIDLRGDVIIEPIYDKIYAKKDKNFGIYFLVEKNGLNGIIDKKGNVILRPECEKIWLYNVKNSGSYFVFKINDKCGVVTETGRCIVPVNYDNIFVSDWTYAFPYIKVCQQIDSIKYHGAYDLMGHEIITPDKYTHIEGKVFNKNGKVKQYFEVKKGRKCGLIDIEGRIILPITEFEWVWLEDDDRFSSEVVVYATDTAPVDGCRIVIMEPYTNIVLEDNIVDLPRLQIIVKADDYFKTKSYKLAAKEYNTAIGMKPEDYLYFNRGLCYYNTSKYSSAIKDFKECIKITERDDLVQKSNKLIELAEAKQAEKNQSIAFITGAILGVALNTINIINNTNNKSRTNPTYSSSSSYSGGGSGVTSNPSGSTVTTSSNKHCGTCGGSGSIVEYTSSYGVSSRKYCADCGKEVVSNHYHKTCPSCGGKGY